MVSYDDFKECMRQRAEEDTGGRAVVKSVRKINGVILDGLSIMTSDSNISPTIYLNSYFDDFKNLQESDDDALDIIWGSIKECYYRHLPKTRFNADDFTNWEYVKDRLEIRLINTDRNRELLEDTVSIPFIDLSIIFAVNMCIIDGANGYVTVKDCHADIWGVSAEDIYDAAMANTRNDWEIIPMCELLSRLRGIRDFDETMLPVNMYVISNQGRSYGASAILNVDVLEEIASITRDRTAYIIPSSVHETILVISDNNEIDMEYMNNMVKEVNSSILNKMDILSDHVYVYNKESHRLAFEGIYEAITA